MKLTYKHTTYACFIAHITQAVVNLFVPLLFVTFETSYGIPLSKITFLITCNFILQLLIDLVSAVVVDRVGYRFCMVAAHTLVAAGLIGIAVLPERFADPFTGLFVSVMIYAVGGGLLEVLISPIVEACPGDNKEAAMSLLHSFFCWGGVGVVLLSTLFFQVFGIQNWKWLSAFWALIPALNALFFTRVPIASLIGEDERGLTILELLKSRIFWILILLMVGSGASEQSISQWASAFAEEGLGVSKTIGDLAGPMFFMGMMGISRILYSKFGEKLDLQNAIMGSGILCVFSYLVIALSPWPVLGLIGCGICGFSVGIFWPGTFSMASASIKGGGTAMFALLALAGDLGCASGPTIVGSISGLMNDNLKAGILAAVVFPLLLIAGVWMKRSMENKVKISQN